MPPLVLAVHEGVLVLRLGRLGFGRPAGVRARRLAGLSAGLLAGLHRHLGALQGLRLGRGVPHLLDELLEVLDDLGLLLAGLLAGIGLAEALLDLAHLLDDLPERALRLLVLVLLLSLPPGELLEALVDALVLAGQVDGAGLIGPGRHRLVARPFAFTLVVGRHGGATPALVLGLGLVLRLAELLEQAVERLVLGRDRARGLVLGRFGLILVLVL